MATLLERCKHVARRLGLIEDPTRLTQCVNCGSWVIVADAHWGLSGGWCCTQECADEVTDRLAW